MMSRDEIEAWKHELRTTDRLQARSAWKNSYGAVCCLTILAEQHGEIITAGHLADNPFLTRLASLLGGEERRTKFISLNDRRRLSFNEIADRVDSILETDNDDD